MEWVGTVADLIDVRKKKNSKNALYKKMKKNLFCSDFLFE
jgi:hypothetical protein